VARKPEPPPQPTKWTIYKVSAKQMRIGEVEAADERGAVGIWAAPVEANRGAAKPVY